jgi:hypothetical protein
MPPRPDQNAAETGHRHFCERQEQSGEAGLNRRMGREYSGSGTSTGGEIRWHGSKQDGVLVGAKPIWACFRPFDAKNAPKPALFFSTFAAYIGGAGSPAMEINGRRNKPFGPGGGTRRLHPSPLFNGGLRRGRNRIDEGVKGVFFLGMVPPLSG